MRLHAWYTIGWAIIVLEFLVWETIGLINKADGKQPFTWFVRKLVGTWTSPLWWLVLGFLVWLVIHFLFIPHK